MLGEYSHRTNKIIALILYVAFFATLYLFTSCTASKINRSTRKSDVTSDKNIEENQNKKSTLFDRSTITEEDYSLRLIPIDPTKDMGQTTNPETGEKQWRNAIPVYEKKRKQTQNNKTKETTEAKTKKTAETSKANTNETTKDKLKLSVPWYAFLILGFFGFATIIGLYFVYNLSKNFSAISGLVKNLENRINTLEG